MFAYIIKSCLLLAILYGCFALLLSRETFHRFNRVVLLGVLVASVVLPAIHLKLKKPSYLCYEEVEVSHIVMIAEPNPNIEQDITTPKPILPEPEETAQVPTFRIDMILVIKRLYFWFIRHFE